MPYKNTKEKKKSRLSTFDNLSRLERKFTEQKKNKCEKAHACVCTCTRTDRAVREWCPPSRMA